MTEYDEKAITRLMDKFDLDRPEAEAMYAKTSEGPNTSYDGDPLKYEIAALEREGKSSDEESDKSWWENFFSDDEEEETPKEKLLRELGGEEGIGALQETYAQEVEQPETEEERYRRQVDTFNGMRSHVSDSDEGYMQGQDPQSIQDQASNQEMTKIVEALQRQAFERGQGGDAAQTPLGGNAGIQGLQQAYQQQVPQQATQQMQGLQNMPPQPNPEQMQQLQQAEAMKRIQMQQMAQQQQGPFAGAGNFRPGY
jgi:hypothetical protein